jgi:LCP family protein required for cell wall assembly
MADADSTEPKPFVRHHTAGQRLVLIVNCVIVTLCFAGALGLMLGKNAGEQARKVVINGGAAKPRPLATSTTSTAVVKTSPTDPSQPAESTSPPDTFPAPEAAAQNFLITGADNAADKACANLLDKGARNGERSDTIMMIRLDPVSKRSAILSFPRDLWVKIPGHGSSRINSAYKLNDPQLLIDTIAGEFDVPVDHFIQIDFCAFQRIVSAIGSVNVPLPYPVRDVNTGLNVATAECHAFDGSDALKYVRSRHLEYQDDTGKWHEDPSADRGRIARQQDFMRRTLTAALRKGLLQPKIISSLYASYHNDLVIDTGLTIDKMIQFVGVVRSVTPSSIRTYQIEATGRNIGGADVLIANKKSTNMIAILNIFRGTAPMAAAPEQIFETTTTQTPVDTAPATSAGPSTGATPTTVVTSTTSTAPATPVDTAPLSNAPKTAIVPDANSTC